MTQIYRAAAALVALLGLAIPRPASAQSQASDSYVLQPGQLRLQATAIYAGYDSRYGVGSTEGLAASLGQPLTASTFAPLLPLSTRLTDFLAATSSAPGATPLPVDGSTLTLGTPDLDLFESRIRAPLEISVGILPRVEVGVSVPILRSEQLIQRFTIEEGTVGANPAMAANAAILARVGPEWSDLGGSMFLPTAGSALGMELQTRVGALTGESLELPEVPGDTALFQGQLPGVFGVPAVRSRVDRYRIGDAQLLGRVRLFSTFGAAPVPVDSAAGLEMRATLLLGVRLPTGTASDTVELLPYPYEIGRTGYSAGLIGDLFLGSRFWATVGARMAAYGAVDLMQLPGAPDAPLSLPGPPQALRFTPGREMEVRIAPRIRLVEGISVGAEYRWTSLGEGRFEGSEGGAGLNLAGGSGQRVGGGLRYSTLPAFAEGRTPFALEMELSYQRSISGPVGAPDTGYTVVEARFLPRLWGRGKSDGKDGAVE